MSQLVYNVDNLLRDCAPEGRVVVFAFGFSFRPFLTRLLEVSVRRRLSRILLVVVPSCVDTPCTVGVASPVSSLYVANLNC